MAFWEHFPYTNFHELNIDWLVQVVKKLSEECPENFEKLSAKFDKLSKEVENFDCKYISELLENYIPAMIYPEITNAGYIVFNLPESWDSITFNTTGIDITSVIQPEYGHLVLSY